MGYEYRIDLTFTMIRYKQHTRNPFITETATSLLPTEILHHLRVIWLTLDLLLYSTNVYIN